MNLSDYTDQEVVILFDILKVMKDHYDKMISGVTVAKELTKQDFQGAFQGLALFGKRMAELEDELQKVVETKRSVEILIRASQMKAQFRREADENRKL